MAREHLLWKWMHDQGKGVDGLHMVRVENVLERGTPDVEGCHLGAAFWAELKGCNSIRTPHSPLLYELTDKQARWLRRRWLCGGSSWLYVRVGDGRREPVRRYLVPGNKAVYFVERQTEADFEQHSLLPSIHGFGAFLQQIRRGRPIA